MTLTEMVDKALSKMGDRSMFTRAEVMDMLLDIRKAAASADETIEILSDPETMAALAEAEEGFVAVADELEEWRDEA